MAEEAKADEAEAKTEKKSEKKAAKKPDAAGKHKRLYDHLKAACEVGHTVVVKDRGGCVIEEIDPDNP